MQKSLDSKIEPYQISLNITDRNPTIKLKNNLKHLIYTSETFETLLISVK